MPCWLFLSRRGANLLPYIVVLMKIIKFIVLAFIAGYQTIPCCAQGQSLLRTSAYSWYGDSVIENGFKAFPLSSDELVSNYAFKEHRWKRRNDLSAYPQLNCRSSVEKAVYNMALDEMVNAIEPDSTFRTGKLWSGVWTRDVSYSVILSMAYMQPEVAMKSLLRKVNKNNCIIQDTGTGGAWPCSTDRLIWAVAAWEIYKVTGNKEWLNRIYPIIRNSVEDDFRVVYDSKTGLFRGESSFIDWREQSYPKWMQPADIYQSECLGTNAVHAQALTVLSNMARLTGDKAYAIHCDVEAKALRKAMNRELWLKDKGFYAQYLYGRNYGLLSPRSETLGEALCILFDVADSERQKTLARENPIQAYGAPVFFPYIEGQPPYHNDAVWPFVASYWGLASAKAGNENGVLNAIGSVYRAACMFTTDKENFVVETGSPYKTQINSDNMLWSLSGSISLVHRLLFGISYEEDRLVFKPFVPRVLSDTRELTGLKYRKSLLDIELIGYGNRIASFSLDGRSHGAFVPDALTGKHRIKIVLTDNDLHKQSVHLVESVYSPMTPTVAMRGQQLSWTPVDRAVSYKIYKDGKSVATVSDRCHYDLTVPGEYQVIAVDAQGFASFASEPLLSGVAKQEYPFVVSIARDRNRKVDCTVNAPVAGWYAVDFLYANGNGSLTQDNKCCIRSLFVDNSFAGGVIFPQRGMNSWNDWGWSNKVSVQLKRGNNLFSLRFEKEDENMNIEVNGAELKQLRVIKINR